MTVEVVSEGVAVEEKEEAAAGRNGCLNTHPALQVGLTESRAESSLTAPVAQLDRAPASGAGCVGSSPAWGTADLILP